MLPCPILSDASQFTSLYQKGYSLEKEVPSLEEITRKKAHTTTRTFFPLLFTTKVTIFCPHVQLPYQLTYHLFGTVGPWNPLYISTSVAILFHKQHQLNLKSSAPPSIVAEWFCSLQCHHHYPLSSVWLLFSPFLYSHVWFVLVVLRDHLHLATTPVPKLVLLVFIKGLETSGDLSIRD